jgi:hypothetical protein
MGLNKDIFRKSQDYFGLFDFGIINASGGSGKVWLALVVVKARNKKARLEKILYIFKITLSGQSQALLLVQFLSCLGQSVRISVVGQYSVNLTTEVKKQQRSNFTIRGSRVRFGKRGTIGLIKRTRNLLFDEFSKKLFQNLNYETQFAVIFMSKCN